MNIPKPVLDSCNELLKPLGLHVTYVHEDVIFVEHNLFLLLHTEEGFEVAFNHECPPDMASRVTLTLFERAAQTGIPLDLFGVFELTEHGEDEMGLKLIPEEEIPQGDGGGHTH